jgi:uncharacterized MAPEG superfamily protein
MECKYGTCFEVWDLLTHCSVNPGQISIVPVVVPFYLGAAPLSFYLTKPGGALQKVLEAALRLVPGGPVANDRVIPALAAVYLFWTYPLTGAFSVSASGMARKEGYDNNHPRRYVSELTGLPLRLRSAHYNLVEGFGGFALAAALVQSINPRDQQSINLLALHTFLKIFVFGPTYVANLGLPRTLSHVLATGSLLAVCWRLATGA